MTFVSVNPKRGTAVDETSFQQLLAAAYVVQQHNDSLRTRESRLETKRVLAEIAEIQSLAAADNLDTSGVARLIADRLRKMTDAAGVSVSLVTDGFLDCAAESGEPARIPGSSLASHSLVATERLKAGQVFESDDAQKDIRLDTTLCGELKTGSLVAAPITHFGEISGLIEIRWDRAKAFQEGDISACRSMAVLMGSLLERGDRKAESPPAAEADLFQPGGSESLGETKASLKVEPTSNPLEPHEAGMSETPVLKAGDLADHCRVCGKPFRADEAFCGQCSMPRVAAAPAEGMQSKWASLWYMQQAHDTLQPRNSDALFEAPSFNPSKAQPRVKESALLSPQKPEPVRSLWTTPGEKEARSAAAPVVTEDASPYRAADREDAASVVARVSQTVGRWGRQTILIAVSSVVIFLILSVAWALSPAPGNGQITRFESVLVELGLAEAPTKPVLSVGRADAQVWVDVHTALYYCEGSDLYGKTPEGRFTTQREAQQDQFQPASQTPCP